MKDDQIRFWQERLAILWRNRRVLRSLDPSGYAADRGYALYRLANVRRGQ